MKHSLALAAALAATLGFGFSANAQAPTHDCAEITARAASHLSYLQTKLAITASEQSAWNAFAAAVSTGAQSVATACNGLANPTATDAPTRFANHLAIASAHVQADQTVLSALKALYAALTTQQQAAFDAAAAHHGMRQHP